MEMAHHAGGYKLHRIALFLDVWYCQERTVTYAAQQLHLSRPYVASTIKPKALTLVVRRFLALVEGRGGAD
jgi:hypothetical protein